MNTKKHLINLIILNQKKIKVEKYNEEVDKLLKGKWYN